MVAKEFGKKQQREPTPLVGKVGEVTISLQCSARQQYNYGVFWKHVP
jgi:hypothetical protein